MEKGRRSAESAYQQRNQPSIRSSTCTVYGRTVGHGPRANKMAALNLTKEAVSPKTEAFRQFRKLQISEKLIAIFNLL